MSVSSTMKTEKKTLMEDILRNLQNEYCSNGYGK